MRHIHLFFFFFFYYYFFFLVFISIPFTSPEILVELEQFQHFDRFSCVCPNDQTIQLLPAIS
jgi:amino acid permease